MKIFTFTLYTPLGYQRGEILANFIFVVCKDEKPEHNTQRPAFF